MERAVPDDRTLALQAAKGREKAFRELLNRYERPVFSLIYRMVRDRGLAEDLSQEAFIRAFNAIGSYNPGYKFSSWMFKIAHNLTIDHLRKRRLDTISIHGSPNAVTADEQARTSLVLDRRRAPARLCGELNWGSRSRLPSRSQTGIPAGDLLATWGIVQEIADIPGIAAGTVKTYIQRARLN